MTRFLKQFYIIFMPFVLSFSIFSVCDFPNFYSKEYFGSSRIQGCSRILLEVFVLDILSLFLQSILWLPTIALAENYHFLFWNASRKNSRNNMWREETIHAMILTQNLGWRTDLTSLIV